MPQAPGECRGIVWKDKQNGHALNCENEWTLRNLLKELVAQRC